MTANSPIHSSLPAHPIDAYAQWAKARWTPGTPIDQSWPSLMDHAVMGLGLPGEASEVLGLFEKGDLPGPALAKEMGDCLYYWAVLCLSVNLLPSSLWPGRATRGAPGAAVNLAAAKERAGLMMSASGAAAEGLKKRLRDGQSTERLRAGLASFAQHWAGLCLDLGLDWEAVMADNVAKLEDRIERDVLRGCGDDR